MFVMSRVTACTNHRFLTSIAINLIRTYALRASIRLSQKLQKVQEQINDIQIQHNGT